MLLFAAIADESLPCKEKIIDEALFSQIAQGNKQSFTTLYRETGEVVYAYALSILKNPMEAEDAMQDTFLKIRSAAHLYKPLGKPLAWIFTITRNICLMKLRQRKHIAYSQNDDMDGDDFSKITDAEDRIVLCTALKCLSDEECQIIILHAVTGWQHREIAKMLSIPVSTVISKYNRGLKKLKVKLEG